MKAYVVSHFYDWEACRVEGAFPSLDAAKRFVEQVLHEGRCDPADWRQPLDVTVSAMTGVREVAVIVPRQPPCNEVVITEVPFGNE